MLAGFERVPVSLGRAFMSVTSDGINFNKNVVTRMGKAPYIIFLLNRAEKKAAIQACDRHDPDALSFCQKERQEKNGVRINLRDVQQEIAHLMKWDLSEHNYRVDGTYIQAESAMIFNLEQVRIFGKKKAGGNRAGANNYNPS